MSGHIYQHYQPEERIFVDRVLDWFEQVEGNYSVVSTYFLNPREQEILQTLGNKRELQIFLSSDMMTGETEMVKAVLAPDFYELDEDDFDMALLEIRYASKFHELKHAQILGTLLGQTGIKREQIGDVLLADKRAQVFVSKKMVTAISQSVTKIGRATVQFKEVAWSEKLEIEEQATRKVLLLSQLRLDKIISESFNIPRNIAANMIESSKVKVNFRELSKKDFQLKAGDLISLRGYGRIKILAMLGLTKKDKQKVEVDIIKNKKR
ncbi:RNA-binding protein [Lactococcus termiticola]|uniref:Cell division protein n=1 Tax=Lactococcus termiticola TaxID=2169526 RepID=A0A2R5HGM8_9LACT|nr:YlmH/Sll1252 family protein [Lactococcus termiticola]GBG97016.1 cell division protein [Lactococcus termiticola]